MIDETRVLREWLLARAPRKHPHQQSDLISNTGQRKGAMLVVFAGKEE